MASCSLGVPNVKILALGSHSSGNGNSPKLVGQPLLLGRKSMKYTGITASLQALKAVEMQSVETQASTDEVKEAKEIKPSSFTTQRMLDSAQVESLIQEICNTSIAEFELKCSGMELHISRNLAEKSSSVQPQPLGPTQIGLSTGSDGAAINGSADSQSLGIMKPESSSEATGAIGSRAADESLATLRSPKVGFFRRSRIIKGKRMPPPCEEKQPVKEGQVLCYIEQLGGQIPIESDVSGELVKILRDDGEPVGYNDALMTILPSFPGIKKLQ